MNLKETRAIFSPSKRRRSGYKVPPHALCIATGTVSQIATNGATTLCLGEPRRSPPSPFSYFFTTTNPQFANTNKQ